LIGILKVDGQDWTAAVLSGDFNCGRELEEAEIDVAVGSTSNVHYVRDSGVGSCESFALVAKAGPQAEPRLTFITASWRC
jgi:hypothetical protein